MYTVVMIRHGESTWNLEKRFTGWCDVPLTSHGEADARDAGALIGQRGLKFDVAFTSNLERAWRTCAIVLSASGQSNIETVRTWRLNERHYGALQGHLKNCPKLIESFGEDKLIEWRRAYHTRPPSLNDSNIWGKIDVKSFQLNAKHMDRNFLDTKLYNLIMRHDSLHLNQYMYDADPFDIDTSRILYPSTESLKDCETRAYGYWNEVIKPRVKAGYRILIVAHANTIRALVKSMDNISDDQIAQLKIPNGVPLVYTLDENFEPILEIEDDIGFQAKYLVSPRNHKKVRDLISMQRQN
jgi:2,3-bisphosphoglycerate-dependent phosphoglycerate mutase